MFIFVFLVFLHLALSTGLFNFSKSKNLTTGDDYSSSKDDFDFVFLGTAYRHVSVSINGAIIVNNRVTEFINEPFPFTGTVAIAPFWSDVDTRGNIPNGNQVTYGALDPSHPGLQQFQEKIRTHASGPLKHFQATRGYIATYLRVGEYSLQTSPNTFQVIIATDGYSSFVGFVYVEINWTGNAQMGFNAGDGVNFFSLPYSRSNQIPQVVTESNVGEPGFWLFRVDTSTQNLYDCNTTSGYYPYPNSGFETGGQVIEVHGVCAKNSRNITCFFGNKESQGRLLSNSSIVCITPPHRIARVNLTVIVDEVTYAGGFFDFKSAQWMPKTISIDIQDGQYLASWTKEYDFARFPCTLNVYGGADPSKVTLVKQIELSQNPIKSIQFEPNNTLFEVYLTITPSLTFNDSSIDSDQLRYFLSTNFELGLFRNLLISSEGKYICKQTYNMLTLNQTLLSEIQNKFPCPNTKKMAKNDNRFALDCTNCGRLYANGSICYVSIGETSTGAKSQCCYGTNGALIVFTKSNKILGGTILLPARNVQDVENTNSILLNFFQRDLFRQACCDVNSCHLFFERSPPITSFGYSSPIRRPFSGDPHWQTIDGHPFTFNGKGEFIVLRVQGVFEIQARTTNDAVTKNATFLSAFAIRAKETASSEASIIQVNSVVDLDGTKRMALKLDRTESYFDGLPFLFHKEAILVKLNQDNLEPLKSLEILYPLLDISIQIDIDESTSWLTFSFKASPNSILFNRTEGLMGKWDGDLSNDLTSKNGFVVPLDSDLRTIHNDFGMSWLVTEEEDSIFVYASGESHGSFSFPNHQASFETPNLESEEMAKQAKIFCKQDPTCVENEGKTCQVNEFCLFDIYVTGNISYGQSSLSSSFTQIAFEMESLMPPVFDLSSYFFYVESGKQETLRINAEIENTKEGEVIVYGLESAPQGMSIDSIGTIRWIVPLSTVFPVSFIVTAHRGEATSQVDVTLNQTTLNCMADSGFPRTMRGQVSVVKRCGRNRYGIASRTCYFDESTAMSYWGPIISQCKNCPKNSTSPIYSTSVNNCTCIQPGYLMLNSTKCVADVNYFKPLHIFLLNGENVDELKSGEILIIPFRQVIYRFIYNSEDPGNKALQFDRKRGAYLRLGFFDETKTFAITLFVSNYNSFHLIRLAYLDSNETIISLNSMAIIVKSGGEMEWKNGNNVPKAIPGVHIDLNRSYFFVVTFGSGNFTLWIDDERIVSFPFKLYPGSNYQVQIGENLIGLIDEFSVYDEMVVQDSYHVIRSSSKCNNSCPWPTVCYSDRVGLKCGPRAFTGQ